MKLRQSNIELLRIVLMMMMLYLHFIKAIRYGGPTNELISLPTSTQGNMFLPFLFSIGMTDAFVLISGWFGIKFSIKGLTNFIFQAFFLGLLLFVGHLLKGDIGFSFEAIKTLFYFTHVGWFFKAYLLLFILSPILNSFIEKVSQKDFLKILILYWGFIFIYGWAFKYSTPWVNNGYSPINFIGLYLLARYTRLYAPKGFSIRGMNITYNKWNLILAYCLPLLIILAISYPLFFDSKKGQILTSYVSPFIVFTSLALVQLSTHIPIRSNQFINKVAKSCFAVYLIQENTFFVNYFNNYSREIFIHYNGITCVLYVAAFLIGIFALCIAIDQIRILVWKQIEKRCFKE